MRNPNLVVIGGNLGGDARYAVTQSGKEVVSFSVGHTRSQFNERSNSWEEANTTWWNVTYWGSDREDLQRLSEQLTRGRRVIVTGRAEQRPYTTKDGRDGVSLDLLASTVSLVPKIGRDTAASNTAAGFDSSAQPPW
jgi:single-strand DNA-binding protein